MTTFVFYLQALTLLKFSFLSQLQVLWGRILFLTSSMCYHVSNKFISVTTLAFAVSEEWPQQYISRVTLSFRTDQLQDHNTANKFKSILHRKYSLLRSTQKILLCKDLGSFKAFLEQSEVYKTNFTNIIFLPKIRCCLLNMKLMVSCFHCCTATDKILHVFNKQHRPWIPTR